MTDTDQSTVINNIICELQFMDGCSYCYLIKGEYSASLELANAIGGIENSQGGQLDIANSTLNQIQRWADSNGY